MTLVASGVTVRHGPTTVLDGVSVDVRAGELAVLAGRNGAGKSTLLQVLAGLLRPTAGQVLLDGVDLDRLPARQVARRRAFLPQRDGLDQPLLGREVVGLGRLPHGADGGVAVERALERVGASWLADRRMDQLSGGERQRIHLARVLAQVDGAGILLLDEPTSALDLASQHEILGLLARLARTGVAVVCVLHDLNLAAAWAERLVVLAGGVVLADGPPVEVITPDLVRRGFGVEAAVHSHAGRPQILVTPHPTAGD